MANEHAFDLVVIGAGPAGYAAAIRAAQLGMKTALVEQKQRLGGTCLNVGCIPSKALLDSASRFHSLNADLPDHGIQVSKPQLDMSVLQQRKENVVARLTSGIADLMKGNDVSRYFARGTLVPGTKGHQVKLAPPDNGSWVPNSAGAERADQKNAQKPGQALPDSIRGKRVILATGSLPVELPIAPFDSQRVLSSTDALWLKAVPSSLAIIGAGAIGLEMAQVWASLGSRVTVVEMANQILPGWDKQVARSVKKELEHLGITFLLETSLENFKALKSSLKIALKGSHSGEIRSEKMLVAVGRRANLNGAGLPLDGLNLTDDGRRIAVDENYETSLPGVYAIGDITPGPMLAHKAEDEALVCVERMAGIPAHLNYATIPAVVYTHPEAAMLGRTEEQLKAEGTHYAKGSFSFGANGRALAMGQATGFVKLLADEHSDRILGAHIVGPGAGDLIAELVTVMEMKGSVEDVARIIHAHPTLPEAVREAAMALRGHSIHSLNK